MWFYVILFICSLTTAGYCTTDFYNLLAYRVTGSTLSTISTSDDLACAEACGKNSSCAAFLLSDESSTCELMTSLTGIIRDVTECSYYVRKIGTVMVGDKTLNFIDQLRISILYSTDDGCPDGWTSSSATCSSSQMNASTCNQLPSVLGATWDGKTCTVPKFTVSYACPSASYQLYNVSESYYCYLGVPAPSAPDQHWDYYNNICYEKTQGNLASIHSAEENLIVNGLGENKVIGLIPTNGISGMVTGMSSIAWFDGTPVDYGNYTYPATGPSISMTYYFTYMAVEGNWITNKKVLPANTTLACKVEATRVFNKVN
uniref:Apple domain-containing protein n=1 Tax=Panagrellus redivivus TaxID=6233 RepID=A0A7E4VWJ1_PANRE